MDFSSILSALPNNVQGYAALLIIACAALSTIIRPPAAGSRWTIPYRLMNILAFNIGWAANHLPNNRAKNSNARDSPPH